MSKKDFNTLIKYIDDEVTVLRIHMEELDDAMQSLKVLVASQVNMKGKI